MTVRPTSVPAAASVPDRHGALPGRPLRRRRQAAGRGCAAAAAPATRPAGHLGAGSARRRRPRRLGAPGRPALGELQRPRRPPSASAASSDSLPRHVGTGDVVVGSLRLVRVELGGAGLGVPARRRPAPRLRRPRWRRGSPRRGCLRRASASVAAAGSAAPRPVRLGLAAALAAAAALPPRARPPSPPAAAAVSSTGSVWTITPRPLQCLAGLAERLEQALADPLAGHLHQARAR